MRSTKHERSEEINQALISFIILETTVRNLVDTQMNWNLHLAV